ncbi:MAG: GTPase-associated system all-helical protein GASH [Candidatus Acidiferrum sp.]
MHRLFAAWLRAAGLEPNNDTSPKHWKVISEYTPTADEIISFARFFYGFSSKEDTSLDKFGTALQDVDTTFSMQDHKRHLSVFAGAGLIAVIERDQDARLADLAALCLICGGAQSARTDVPVPEMPKIAARYIESRTGRRASIPVGTVEVEADSRIGKLERELTIVSEEANMLWWLISEYSRDRNRSWEKVGLSATSIIAGKELADLTRVIPGPVAAAAFLDRIIRLSDSAKSQRPVRVKAAIEKTPREWREQYAFKGAEGVEDLAPVSNAIKLSLTVSEGGDWSAVFEKGTGLKANSELLPNVVAYQVFLERLLARLSGEVG